MEDPLAKFDELSQPLLSFMRNAKEALLRHDSAGGQSAYDTTDSGIRQFRALLDARKQPPTGL